jgi:uncharacterized membrane protein YraQ (UPF0718 family)
MLGKRDFAKLDVLESKFEIYENLSKEMLSKLENAVEKISDSNTKIANILTKHDEKLEQSDRTDQLIIKMLEDYKELNSKEHKQVVDRVKTLEEKVEDLFTFRWKTAGTVGLFVFVVTIISGILSGVVSSGAFNKVFVNENIEEVRTK